jgi:glycosidase
VFGDALENAIVLSLISRGLPMIYNGQEAGNPKRLDFFDRDPIEWREHSVGNLYRSTIALKKSNSALWNGGWGAPMIQVFNSVPASVFSFVRANEKDRIFAVFNFSSTTQLVTFEDTLYHGEYREFLTGAQAALDGDFELKMEPWTHRIFVKKEIEQE